MCVQWGNSISSKFSVGNGLKQGGILSPKLFNVYVNDWSVKLSESRIGGKLAGKLLNHLCYADDICLVSISSAGMQKLLNICNEFASENDLLFSNNEDCVHEL